MPDTSHRLVAVEDALRVLDEEGAQSIATLARELGIRRLEARIVLLHAHWHGLVRTTGRDGWELSDRGRQALAGRLDHPSIPASVRALRARASAFAWRRRLRPGYIARGGVPLALGAVVCVAGVAVASSSLPSGPAPPPIAKAHVKRVRHHRRHGSPLGARTVVTRTTIIAPRSFVRPARVTVVAIHSLQKRQTRHHRRALVVGPRQLGANSQQISGVARRHQHKRR
jgi:hypothetical protein